jgi:NADPH:quinone reductase-like Zn-dependent oxidoreductase
MYTTEFIPSEKDPLENEAAWITKPKGNPLELENAPMHVPSSGEILIRNASVALNHIDTTIQDSAPFPLNYPAILGQDTSSVVVAVGPDVTRFEIGDRVVALAAAYATLDSRYGAFQEYTIVRADLASKIPYNMRYDEACVLPSGLSTAACALFQDLGLNMPTTEQRGWETKFGPNNDRQPPVLIWGGSSSVGCNAIQLCVAAGYDVFTTASPHNMAYVASLGACRVYDYNDKDVVEQLVEALAEDELAGAFHTAGSASVVTTAEVVRRCKGSKRMITTLPVPAGIPTEVSVKQVRGDDIRTNSLGKYIYESFLPKALESKTIKPAPRLKVVTSSLYWLQEGLNDLRKGVSGQKLVVHVSNF